MAYKSSGTLSVGQTYNLGEYALRLIVTKDSYEQQTHIQCNCSNGTERAQKGVDEGYDINIRNWRVEANESTADVYATKYITSLDTSPIKKPFLYDATGKRNMVMGGEYIYSFGSGEGYMTFVQYNLSYYSYIFASANAGASVVEKEGETITNTYNLTSTYTHGGKTVYYSAGDVRLVGSQMRSLSPKANDGYSIGRVLAGDEYKRIAWTMIYESLCGDEEFIVARFAIDLGDAGGGSGGDWDEPGDTGDPSTTLEVTVTGALSGRHNDPLNDTSYAYTPSDQDAATVYGSGGNGGHGGGGGAGASTVIIYKIATDRAGNTEETAIAKRHGYGSGGGKGGTGAGGCILVYY